MFIYALYISITISNNHSNLIQKCLANNSGLHEFLVNVVLNVEKIVKNTHFVLMFFCTKHGTFHQVKCS